MTFALSFKKIGLFLGVNQNLDNTKIVKIIEFCIYFDANGADRICIGLEKNCQIVSNKYLLDKRNEQRKRTHDRLYRALINRFNHNGEFFINRTRCFHNKH